MQGLLADVNLQGHLADLRIALAALDLMPLVEELSLGLATFRDLGLDRRLEDRPLWEYCQREGWVLFTHDRNDDGPNSLHRTLTDSWRPGHLPILTLSNEGRFRLRRDFTERVAEDIASVLLDLSEGIRVRDHPRIYVPLRWP